MYISPVRFTDRVPGTLPTDSRHRHFNYELCQGINLTHLSATLEEMVKEKRMNQGLADIFYHQASALRAAILTENNRAFEM